MPSTPYFLKETLRPLQTQASLLLSCAVVIVKIAELASTRLQSCKCILIGEAKCEYEGGVTGIRRHFNLQGYA